MFRKCKWWLYIVLGFAAGIVIYIILPENWLLFMLCAAIITICCTVLFV